MQRILYNLRTHYPEHFRKTISLSVPVIVAQLGLVLMGVIDNMMIGDVGYEYLSAASLANSIFFIITVLGIGITFAISALVAEADAAGKPGICSNYLQQGIWVSIFTSVILAVLIWCGSLLLPFLNQPEQDVELAQPYLNILSISVLPMLMFMAFKQFSDGLSLTRPAMYITLAGLIFNTFANWLLIYGNWGFPKLELTGAGYGTLCSRIFMMILMVAYILFNARFKKYQILSGLGRLDLSVIKKIIRIGIPSGFQYFFEVGAFGGAVLLIGLIGMKERSAHQIVISMAATAYMVTTGFAAGATIRVGNALGKRDYVNMQRAGFAGIILSTVFMTFSAIVFLLGRYWIPSLFVEDQEVLKLAAGLMIITAFFQVFDGIQAVAIGILRGLQDVAFPTAITFIAYWLIALPVGSLLAFPLGMGLKGIWYGFVISLAFAAVSLTYRFWKLTERKRLQKEEDRQDVPLTANSPLPVGKIEEV